MQCDGYKAWKKKNNGNQQAQIVSDEPEEGVCFHAGTSTGSDLWFIDSGASFHCTPQREAFSDYSEGQFGKAVVGNGQSCPIVGKGTVKIKIPGRGYLKLYETQHIPDISKNLISTSKLDKEGMTTQFGGGEWKITAGARLIAKGKRSRTLYTLEDEEHPDLIATAAANTSLSRLWH